MNRLCSIFLISLLPLASAFAEPAVNDRGVSFEQFTRGGQLFQQHCAECHGAAAQGAPNWRSKGPDGKYGAPPLNGTGHAWHHSRAALEKTVRDGTQAIGGSMPSWKDRLGAEDTDSIIGWIVSRWPDEVYAAWERRFGPKGTGKNE